MLYQDTNWYHYISDATSDSESDVNLTFLYTLIVKKIDAPNVPTLYLLHTVGLSGRRCIVAGAYERRAKGFISC